MSADPAMGPQGNTTPPAGDPNSTGGTVLGGGDPPAVPAPPPAPEPTVPVAPTPAPEPKVPVVPEKYEAFKLPEGMDLDTALATEFHTSAKDMGLSQENAQKMIDLAVRNREAQATDQAEQWATMRESWVTEVKNDPEFGGDKFTETVERANRALRTFGSEKLTNYLQDSGLGDYPELITLFARVDKATGEDTILTGEQGKVTESLSQLLYPNQGKKET